MDKEKFNSSNYKNNYAREKYDRVQLLLPKNEKKKIKAIAESLNMSLNEYIYALVCEDIGTGESKLGTKKQGFSDEHKQMLDKWQVAHKYHEMIEDMSYSKTNGYFIYLKPGYINDATASRSIHCMKTAELRRIIVKTRKKAAT